VAFVKFFLLDTKLLYLFDESVLSLNRDAEIDLVFGCESTKPLWSGSHGVVPVECKNWKKPVGALHISRFADKVGNTTSYLGIFAARAFTKPSCDAIKTTRLKQRIVIGMLSNQDFLNYTRGLASATTLLESSIRRSMLF